MAQVASGGSVLAKLSNMSNQLTNLTFTLGGQPFWTRNLKQAGAAGGLNMFGVLARTKNWADLEPYARQTLVKGGYTERDWGFIRSNAGTITREMRVGTEGRAAFDASRFNDLPDEIVAQHLGNPNATAAAIRAEKSRLESSFNGALKSFVDDGVITPRARDTAFMRMNVNKADSPIAHAIISFGINLLGHPITYIRRAMAAELRSGKPVSGLAMLAASSLFYGTVATVATDLTRGRTREWDSDDPEIILNNVAEVTLRGGYGGIFASLVMDSVRFGKSPTGLITDSAPLGQLDRTSSQILKISGSLIEGDLDQAKADGARLAKSLGGPLNTPLIRPIYEQLILNHVIEMNDPVGFARERQRMEDRGLIPF